MDHYQWEGKRRPLHSPTCFEFSFLSSISPFVSLPPSTSISPPFTFLSLPLLPLPLPLPLLLSHSLSMIPRLRVVGSLRSSAKPTRDKTSPRPAILCEPNELSPSTDFDQKHSPLFVVYGGRHFYVKMNFDFYCVLSMLLFAFRSYLTYVSAFTCIRTYGMYA